LGGVGASTGFLDRCRFFGLQATSQLRAVLGAVADDQQRAVFQKYFVLVGVQLIFAVTSPR